MITNKINVLYIFILLVSSIYAQKIESDLFGLWEEINGSSTFQFTEEGGYAIIFEPPLSDGTTKFGGESYDLDDNNHFTFTVIMGRMAMKIIEVDVTITSSNVLRFKLDGKTYRFIKSIDNPKETAIQSE